MLGTPDDVPAGQRPASAELVCVHVPMEARTSASIADEYFYARKVEMTQGVAYAQQLRQELMGFPFHWDDDSRLNLDKMIQDGCAAATHSFCRHVAGVRVLHPVEVCEVVQFEGSLFSLPSHDGFDKNLCAPSEPNAP